MNKLGGKPGSKGVLALSTGHTLKGEESRGTNKGRGPGKENNAKQGERGDQKCYFPHRFGNKSRSKRRDNGGSKYKPGWKKENFNKMT